MAKIKLRARRVPKVAGVRVIPRQRFETTAQTFDRHGFTHTTVRSRKFTIRRLG